MTHRRTEDGGADDGAGMNEPAASGLFGKASSPYARLAHEQTNQIDATGEHRRPDATHSPGHSLFASWHICPSCSWQWTLAFGHWSPTSAQSKTASVNATQRNKRQAMYLRRWNWHSMTQQQHQQHDLMPDVGALEAPTASESKRSKRVNDDINTKSATNQTHRASKIIPHLNAD
jgi:hypothetical protein